MKLMGIPFFIAKAYNEYVYKLKKLKPKLNVQTQELFHIINLHTSITLIGPIFGII